MKRLLLLLAVVVAFTFTAVAQTSGGAGTSGTTGTDQTTSGAKAKKGKKAAAGEEAGEAKKSAKGGAKESSLTGCLAAGDTENTFKLTNGRFKKGVEVQPASGTDLKAHVGHQVKLTGTWAKGGEAGESAKTEAAEHKGKGTPARHFVASNIAHIADTCPPAGAKKASAGGAGGEGGAAAGGKSKGKKGSDTGAAGTKPPGL